MTDLRCNITGRFLKPGNDAFASFVVSAGPNQTVDTNFQQARATAVGGGDDIFLRLR